MANTFQLESFHNGTNCKAYEFFGCHMVEHGKFVFRVWAPHAVSVSLVGTFNQWNEDSAVMERLSDGESFEITVNATIGDLYKFCITTADGRKLYKADPFAFCSDLPNSTSSKICNIPQNNICNDSEETGEKPVNIYEVSLLSWKRHKDKT